ncbi:MAG: hypothetical protein V3T41_11635, partial [bacterium]
MIKGFAFICFVAIQAASLAAPREDSFVKGSISASLVMPRMGMPITNEWGQNINILQEPYYRHTAH